MSTSESQWQMQVVLSATAHIVRMNRLPCCTNSGPATQLFLLDLHLHCENAYSLVKDVLKHLDIWA